MKAAFRIAATCLVAGCGVFGRGGPGGPDPEAAVGALLAPWTAAGDTVVLAGFRAPDGKTSPETEALDEVLLSAAVRAGVEARPDAGIAGGARAADLRWLADEPLPDDWRQLPGRLVAGGQLRVEPPWVYVRLLVAEPATGRVRADDSARLAAADVRRLVAERQRRSTGAEAAAAEPLQIDLHLVARRNEGGFPEALDVVEGGELNQGDEFQIRFRSETDCEVLAFLYRSDGAQEQLLSGSFYAGRWYYAPGENSWQALTEADRVYTLYFLAAPRIEEDRSTLWEELARLQNEGRVERFRGLEQIDAAVVDLLQRTAPAGDSLLVQRGSEGVERGEQERLVYDDGTSLTSRAERLEGKVIARAYSTLVIFR